MQGILHTSKRQASAQNSAPLLPGGSCLLQDTSRLGPCPSCTATNLCFHQQCRGLDNALPWRAHDAGSAPNRRHVLVQLGTAAGALLSAAAAQAQQQQQQAEPQALEGDVKAAVQEAFRRCADKNKVHSWRTACHLGACNPGETIYVDARTVLGTLGVMTPPHCVGNAVGHHGAHH